MPTSTTNYGLIKPGTDDPILIGQLNDNADVIDATLKSLSDALDVAKLGIKYKGEVNYYSNLPTTGVSIGDAYTVKYAGSSGTTPDGTEYVWGTVSGTNQWINFSKDSYTKAEVDALLALKQNALSSTQLDAVNSGINSTKVTQIETNENNISVIDILSTVTAASGYTIDSKSTLYKQGKHVFGTLIIQKSTAYSTTQYTAATLTYKPAKPYLGGAFLSPDWGVTDIGYVYIHPTSGELKLQANPAYRGSDTYMYVPLDFVTA